jgi:hypothetical protein
MAVDKDYTLACAVLVGLVVDFSGKIFIHLHSSTLFEHHLLNCGL